MSNTSSVTSHETPSFYDYCIDPKRRTRRTTGNYSADFINDVRADDTFPRKATRWDEIDAYLWSLRADDGAFTAGKRLFRRYQKAQGAVQN